MKLGGARRDDDFEINVIPLIDVMLTLLMFFVLTATFDQTARLRVSLPQASESAEAEPELGLTIQVDSDGRYFIDNNEVLNPNVETLKEALVQIAGDDRTRPVMIRADAQTAHQSVVTVMDALGQVGFSRLSIATTPQKEAPKK
jgi:biopolymer transport protein ExbD